jgi:hypothetical protein
MDRDIKGAAALTLSGAGGRAWYLTDRAGVVSVTWEVKLKSAVRPRRAPVPGGRGYR